MPLHPTYRWQLPQSSLKPEPQVVVLAAPGSMKLSYDLVQITGTAHITDAGGNLFGMDPMLGLLGNNGGPTNTLLPAPNSPVINAGDPAFASPPYTDQRGDPPVYGGGIDIGAVETQKELFLPLVRR